MRSWNNFVRGCVFLDQYQRRILFKIETTLLDRVNHVLMNVIVNTLPSMWVQPGGFDQFECLLASIVDL